MDSAGAAMISSLKIGTEYTVAWSNGSHIQVNIEWKIPKHGSWMELPYGESYYVPYECFVLVDGTTTQPKYKVGDRLIHKCNRGVIQLTEYNSEYGEWSSNYVRGYRNCDRWTIDYLNDNFTKVCEGGGIVEYKPNHSLPNYKWYIDENTNVPNVPTEKTIFNKIKDTTMNLVKFAKDLTLSAEEKLLRKYGLKQDDGIYTQSAIDLIQQKLCKDNEQYLIDLLNEQEKENKKNAN